MSGIYYFGYGAMVNPVSRSRRNVETVMETPAVLKDYRLTFAYGGAGNILKKRGWDIHGILMECKAEKDWKLIEEFDTGYDCLTLDVFPYGSNDAVQARVFVMSRDEGENAKLPTERLPQERYIKIIVEGMRFHKVDEEYIDYQIMNVPYIPNRKPEEYLKFPLQSGSDIKPISHKHYMKHAQSKDWMLIGSSVIQIGEHDPDSPFVKWIKAKLVGKGDGTWCLLQTLYDPDLPVCDSEKDVTSVHTSWAENQLMENFDQADVKGVTFHFLKNHSESGGLISSIKRLVLQHTGKDRTGLMYETWRSKGMR